jgi:UDP-3-O-[3-hydroxymyristoyl] glucosamine N-acyltransferase
LKEYTLAQISDLIPNSKILNSENPESIRFTSLAPLNANQENFLSFLSAKSHLAEAKQSKAVALVVNQEIAAGLTHCPLLVVDNVDIQWAKILELVFPPKKSDGIIATTAIIHKSAKVGKGTSLGNYVVIGANSHIGDDCIIEDGVKIAENVFIGNSARIGMNCVFHNDTRVGNNFTVFGNSTFGGDGFKFVTLKGIHHKIPQVGKVIIGNDVEIGSNCTVDRGGLADTIIGNGCKFDNMVHIGHNVIIGDNVIIAGQSGVAGSTKIANGVIIGGGCCISDHLTLPEGTIVAGGTGMRTSPKKPDVYIGWDWGMTFAEFQKARVNIKHLVTFNKWASRIKELEKKMGISSED